MENSTAFPFLKSDHRLGVLFSSFVLSGVLIVHASVNSTIKNLRAGWSSRELIIHVILLTWKKSSFFKQNMFVKHYAPWAKCCQGYIEDWCMHDPFIEVWCMHDPFIEVWCMHDPFIEVWCMHAPFIDDWCMHDPKWHLMSNLIVNACEVILRWWHTFGGIYITVTLTWDININRGHLLVLTNLPPKSGDCYVSDYFHVKLEVFRPKNSPVVNQTNFSDKRFVLKVILTFTFDLKLIGDISTGVHVQRNMPLRIRT